MKSFIISSTATGIGGAALSSLIFVAYNCLKGETGNSPEGHSFSDAETSVIQGKPSFLNAPTSPITGITLITQTEEDTDREWVRALPGRLGGDFKEGGSKSPSLNRFLVRFCRFTKMNVMLARSYIKTPGIRVLEKG